MSEALNPCSERTVKPFLIAWCICLIALELYGAVFVNSNKSHTFDFPSFYTAEYLARTEPAHLYDLARQADLQLTFTSRTASLPFYHLSYEPFVLAPFSILPYRLSYFAFIAFNMLLLMAVFFVLRPAFSSPIEYWQPRPGLMLFIFVPLLSAIVLGQDSVLSLLLYCLIWRQLEAGKNWSAGFFLALALFKFQIVIPVAAMMLIRKNWRFIAGFLITSVGVLAASLSIVGSAGMAKCFQILLNAGASIDKTLSAQRAMGLSPLSMPNLTGQLFAVGGRFLHSPLAFNVLCAVCSFALFIWCARFIRHAELKVAFSIAILFGLLVSYHLFIYDLTLVMLPVALLAGRIHRYVLLALFGLPIILFQFGSNSFFLLALPILAMLSYVIITNSKSSALAQSANHPLPI